VENEDYTVRAFNQWVGEKNLCSFCAHELHILLNMHSMPVA
jgi:hypothetical protein